MPSTMRREGLEAALVDIAQEAHHDAIQEGNRAEREGPFVGAPVRQEEHDEAGDELRMAAALLRHGHVAGEFAPVLRVEEMRELRAPLAELAGGRAPKLLHVHRIGAREHIVEPEMGDDDLELLGGQVRLVLDHVARARHARRAA